ncbi:MAG: GDSL-type esterase/lipase family protein [Gaiellaceae bacterium]
MVKAARPRVTFIGDSVADAVSYVTPAQALLARGVRLQLELAECRRLVEASCSVGGVQPETALDLIEALGRKLGPVVVIAVGYNDYERLYPHDMQQVLSALHAAGVEHVLWLTLRAVHASYVPMNADIRALARTSSCLTVVDWNRYSRSHPSWFASDGLHLSPAGAAAMARLLHRTLLAMTIA